MADQLLGAPRKRFNFLYIIVLVLALLFFSRSIAEAFISYAWWNELHQLDTWVNQLLYGTGPFAAVALLFFAALFAAFLTGLNKSTDREWFGFLQRRTVQLIGLIGCALLALLAASSTIDTWTVVRFFGGLRLPPMTGEYVDPIFGQPLHFYFFSLPFYDLLLKTVLVGSVLSILIHWVAAHAEQLSRQLGRFQNATPYQFAPFSFRESFDGTFIRVLAALFLLAVAVKVYFDRYRLLFDDHGQYLVGADWVADHLIVPLQWTLILGAIASGILVLARKARFALPLLLLLPLRFLLPPLVASIYVRPNELALERSYIQHHIDATRSAFGLTAKVTESNLQAASEIPIDMTRHGAVLDNVRLWDWRAFHDTISQIQPLRPYIYFDTDVDRYQIDGRLRQVLIAPRELDIRQLGEARSRWINPHLIYTHGYGFVLAESTRITPDGLPMLFVKDAPPVVSTPSLKVSQPEIYYSEITHEPVYVNTAQEEFNFPSGSESKYTRYTGTGGFPISSFFLRLAAAIDYGDPNVVLTSYLKAESRMMIHRGVLDRLNRLAGFLSWDSDPYLVLDSSGKLVWIVDGYMASDAHPYSRPIDVGKDGDTNYVRNSVKATVDAYTGETNLYIFDSRDILIAAYRQLFPTLFKPASAMPADLRQHVRYPETLFNAQAEIYRSFHMKDPEAFYNRADFWDLSKTANRSGNGEGNSAFVSPTYVVAALPGANTPEFMLFTTFTPANKDNLIGVMYARCDGEHLGELVFQELSKSNIIYGPMQIDARINQDGTISKDLSLWNQQGSQVLRGQTLVLPIDNSFLYVEPIYIQASQASMPQLKKVALAMGNRLAYADTYEQALAQLVEQLGGTLPRPNPVTAGPQPSQPSITSSQPSARAVEVLGSIRAHLQRYRELSAQGKWADAGKELDEIQQLVGRQ